MVDLDKNIMTLLRSDARFNLSKFSRDKGVSAKRVHYEFGKVKKDVDKFVSFLDFEALGFKRLIVFFLDAVEGLAISSNIRPFFINNSVRLDNGLFVEYVFFSDDELNDFLNILNKKNVKFENYFVKEVLKQECFMP